MSRKEMYDSAKLRIKDMNFGQPITNICAPSNPRFHSYFVRYIPGKKLVECTDMKGKFWKTDMTVIYPEHIPEERVSALYAPIWEVCLGGR